MIMNKIVAVLGGGAVGKDTIRGMLLESHGDCFISAVSTTTRPPRVGEENHVHYHFINNKEFNEAYVNDEFIEIRQYTVANGDTWQYGYTYEEINSKLEQNNILIVVDLEGFMDFKVQYGDQLVGIYIELDRDTRIQRYLNRDNITFDMVEEAVRRIKDDDERAFLDVDAWADYIVKNPKSSSDAMSEILEFLQSEGHLQLK